MTSASPLYGAREKSALSRTRVPYGGKLWSLYWPQWLAGATYARRTCGTVKRTACVISPEATSACFSSPGRIGRPAASAEVQPAGRTAFSLRSHFADEL